MTTISAFQEESAPSVLDDEFESPGPSSELSAAIAVALLDSRTMLRQALVLLLSAQPDVRVVAQGAKVADIEDPAVEADVIVTEIELPDTKPSDVIRQLREVKPESAILVLTLVSVPAKIQAVLAAGADGYLLKTANADELIAGIRAVARGEPYLQPSLGVELARWNSPVDTSIRLSAKEERVLGLLALGHTNAEIARMVGASLRTVETHRSRILQKLGGPTRAELVQYAHAAGLVDVDPE
ncbi:MAG: response regulator transcription factor [Acidimicrobiales bacterium]